MVDGVVGAVKVKPLAWTKSGAATQFGNYIVTCEDHDDRTVWFVLFGGKVLSKCGEHDSEASAKAAAQADYEARIMAALDVQPMDVKISLDTTHVRAMLDDAEKSISHLSTIAATITVNALRHGATHAQIMDFITGKSDFVNWLRDQVKTHPVTVQDAARVPEIAEMIDAVDYIVDGMGISYPDYEIDPDEDYLDAANVEWVKDTLSRLATALRAITDTD